MDYESLGHMERAPLVYSLAMIEFAPVPAMAEFSESIMEALRDSYPDIGEFKTPNLRIDVDSTTGETKAEQTVLIQWRMNDANGDFGIVFGKERLVFHTTKYETFPVFAERIKPVIETVFKIANIKYVKNIGIRHIDNILPIDGRSITDLIKPGYLCPEQNGNLVADSSRVEYVYKSNCGLLYIRCYMLNDHPRVPQDLFPPASQLSADYGLMIPLKEKFVLVDTDHIHVTDKLQPANIESIIQMLDELHKQNSLGFRALVEEDAIETWRKGEPN